MDSPWFVRFRYVRYRLSDTDLDLLDKDIPSKHFVCLQDVLKTSSWRLQRDKFLSSNTSSRRICKTSSRRLGRQNIVMLKTFWRRLQDMSWRRLQDQQMFAGTFHFLLTKLNDRYMFLKYIWRFIKKILKRFIYITFRNI